MNPSDDNFYQRFEQSISGQQVNGTGDIILGGDQKKNRKKIIIIALIVIAVLVAVLVGVFAIKNVTSNFSGEGYRQAAKEYARAFIFGQEQGSKTEFDKLSDYEYYFINYGQDGQTYLTDLENKAINLKNNAANDEQKAAANTQYELLKFYKTARVLLADYTAEQSYSAPEDNDQLIDYYEDLTNFVRVSQANTDAFDNYTNGIISEEEYQMQMLELGHSESAVRADCGQVYKEMAQYVKEAYAKE